MFQLLFLFLFAFQSLHAGKLISPLGGRKEIDVPLSKYEILFHIPEMRKIQEGEFLTLSLPSFPKQVKISDITCIPSCIVKDNQLSFQNNLFQKVLISYSYQYHLFDLTNRLKPILSTLKIYDREGRTLLRQFLLEGQMLNNQQITQKCSFTMIPFENKSSEIEIRFKNMNRFNTLILKVSNILSNNSQSAKAYRNVKCSILGHLNLSSECIFDEQSQNITVSIDQRMNETISLLFNINQIISMISKTKITIQRMFEKTQQKQIVYCQKRNNNDRQTNYFQTNLQQDSCLSVVIDSPSQWYFNSYQNLTFQVTPSTDFEANTNYSIFLPSGYQNSAYSCTVQSVTGSCSIDYNRTTELRTVTFSLDSSSSIQVTINAVNLLSPSTQPDTNFTFQECSQIPFVLSCTLPCQTCSSSDQTSCSSCYSGTFLSVSACVTTCPSMTFGNSSTNQCQACEQNCLSCISAQSCDTCVEGYINYGSNCITNCPVQTYQQNDTCYQCFMLCETCSNSSYICQTCISGFYISNGICVLCPLSCAECTSSSVCTSCINISGVTLNNNQCTYGCDEGYYLNSSTTCTSCFQTGCVYCSNTQNCTICGQGYYNYGYYISEYNCRACPGYCTTCSSYNICLSCIQGSTYSNYSCSGCGEGYYQFNQLGAKCFPSPVGNAIIPLPFTICSLILIIVCIVSKKQKPETNGTVMFFSLNCFIQLGAMITLIILFFKFQYFYYNNNFYVAVIVIMFAYFGHNVVLNMFTIPCDIFEKDLVYLKWLEKNRKIRNILNCLSLLSFRIIYLKFSKAFGNKKLTAAINAFDLKFFTKYRKYLLYMSVQSTFCAMVAPILIIHFGSDPVFKNVVFESAMDCLIVTIFGSLPFFVLYINPKIIAFKVVLNVNNTVITNNTERISEMLNIETPTEKRQIVGNE